MWANSTAIFAHISIKKRKKRYQWKINEVNSSWILIINQYQIEITINDANCVRRNMYVARRKFMLPLPKKQENVMMAVNEIEVKTDKEENYVLGADDDN